MFVMGPIGFTELVIPLLILGIVILFLTLGTNKGSKLRSAVSPLLVLKKFKVIEKDPKGEFIEISGRASGFLSWLLTTMGLHEITSFKITNDEVNFNVASLYGEVFHVVSLSRIASVQCGYYKPINLLIIGGLFLVSSVFLGRFAIITILAGIVLIIIYFFKKEISLGIETAGGAFFQVNFKKSFIENVAVDIDKAREAIALIRQKVIEAEK